MINSLHSSSFAPTVTTPSSASTTDTLTHFHDTVAQHDTNWKRKPTFINHYNLQLHGGRPLQHREPAARSKSREPSCDTLLRKEQQKQANTYANTQTSHTICRRTALHSLVALWLRKLEAGADLAHKSLTALPRTLQRAALTLSRARLHVPTLVPPARQTATHNPLSVFRTNAQMGFARSLLGRLFGLSMLHPTQTSPAKLLPSGVFNLAPMNPGPSTRP
ncbi:uncharacterized protein CCOS01_11993 [Colletotrichum costaricense]|uniref:Uncharacterized protein n=1 Tax=Colletotrichum costaricense TaxID=1209916 RepID=A0AAJ0DWT8_9PEZI|nr:uncharacterized protein CCOS01_11993 [Colletotrichum costaricense]KAK1517736.1 hypothetical protein CCOS01_11993 [Colletotrichum costaricense]